MSAAIVNENSHVVETGFLTFALFYTFNAVQDAICHDDFHLRLLYYIAKEPVDGVITK